MEKLVKPVYLTREERQQIALELRKQEVEKFQKEQSQRKQSILSDKPKRKSSSGSANVSRFHEKELEAIKERYLGNSDENSKRSKRWNDRKFIFDWHAEDDTSQDFNDLYSNQHQAQMFGRGHMAGLAPQKSPFYEKYLSSRRSTEDSTRLEQKLSSEEFRTKKQLYDDRHWSEKPLDLMTYRDWRIFKEDFNISTKGGVLPNPIRSWAESALPQSILNLIQKVGYTDPTPIQRQAVPIALINRDLIGIAETGSGKTLAFLLPMLVFISERPRLSEDNILDGPYALVLAPTRELALQIEAETLKFARPLGFNCVSIVGGHSISGQSFNLRNGAEIIIATPGRLRDCLDQHVLALNQCTYIVMDEADRMVDLGFEQDVTYILNQLPTSHDKPDSEDAENAALMRRNQYRQTIMFSATMPPAVERLAKRYLKRPAMAIVGTAGQAVESVELIVEMISEEKKRSRLLEVLNSGFEAPIIIFVNLKKNVDLISKALDSRGYKSITLHGGKSQEAREIALSQLKDGTKEILVATDVAGRGIDIKDVSLVINYDMAKTIEDFIHRIGRTGRAGSTGVSITFLTQDDSDVFYDLKQLLLKSPKSTCPSELFSHEAANTKPGTVKQKRKSEETIYAN